MMTMTTEQAVTLLASARAQHAALEARANELAQLERDVAERPDDVRDEKRLVEIRRELAANMLDQVAAARDIAFALCELSDADERVHTRPIEHRLQHLDETLRRALAPVRVQLALLADGLSQVHGA